MRNTSYGEGFLSKEIMHGAGVVAQVVESLFSCVRH